MVDWKEGRMERKEEERREREREKEYNREGGKEKKEREVRRNGHSPPSTTHQNP